jgi:hypothetical protein
MTNSNPVPSGPKKGQSPWMWVGIGCGITALLAFGGCVAFVGIVGQKAAQQMGKPLTQKEAMAKLGDIPIYQPSTFNETMTKGAQFGSSLVPGEFISGSAAFDTNDGPDKVIDWYQQELAAKGYHQLPKQPTLNSNLTQASFQKESDGILIQVQDSSSRSGNKYTLLLMRMNLLKSKTSS